MISLAVTGLHPFFNECELVFAKACFKKLVYDLPELAKGILMSAVVK